MSVNNDNPKESNGLISNNEINPIIDINSSCCNSQQSLRYSRNVLSIIILFFFLIQTVFIIFIYIYIYKK